MRPKFSSFGLPPGLWRLVWFGRFAKPAVANQLPALNAFFRRQSARPAANTRLADASASDLFKTTIPVAQLVHFPLLTSIDVAPTVLPGTGSVNSVGVVQPTPNVETKVVRKKLCFDRQNIELVERVLSPDSAGTLPASVKDFLGAEGLPSAWRSDRDYSSHLLFFKRERVLIPCVEVFRALYA